MRTLASFTRQMQILPPRAISGQPFVLIGAGGIGSPLAFTLAKMGVTDLTIWDDDKVEAHNLPSQLYKLTQLGKGKAESIAANIKEYAQITTHPVSRKYDGSTTLNGIVFSAVDSIEARRTIWAGIKKGRRVPLYIEARMAAELFQIYPIPMNDKARVARYDEMLAKKTKPFVAACTAAAIFYTVMASAGVMGEVLKSHLTGTEVPKSITVDLKSHRMVIE